MTKHDFYALFAGKADAKGYEADALTRSFLPAHARTVRDGGKATPEYWTWLCNQANQDGHRP